MNRMIVLDSLINNAIIAYLAFLYYTYSVRNYSIVTNTTTFANSNVITNVTVRTSGG
ncbi:MAG TPA: hypothetical protein VKA09_04215 [Nitrososphaeraceae archaeon]|nr:hypothetical protein [Nitrososphaeraceae archaeon]